MLAGAPLVPDTDGGQLLEQQGEVVHFDVGAKGRSLESRPPCCLIHPASQK